MAHSPLQNHMTLCHDLRGNLCLIPQSANEHANLIKTAWFHVSTIFRTILTAEKFVFLFPVLITETFWLLVFELSWQYWDIISVYTDFFVDLCDSWRDSHVLTVLSFPTHLKPLLRIR
jgi:hypothetical protein